MADFHIYIGYRTVSTWSLRGWLPMKKAGVPFDETLIRYRSAGGQGGARPAVADRQGAVPRPQAAGWRRGAGMGFAGHRRISGRDRARGAAVAGRPGRAGACARRSRRRCIPASGRCASICRWRFSTACRIRTTRRPIPRSPASRRCGANAASAGARAGGGPFLFGRWSIADAAYAPVVTRFRTYGVKLAATGAAYMEAVLADPDFLAWEEQAKKDPPPEPPVP